MEKDGDINDGSYTTEFRELDTRIGRWLSVDPLAARYLWQSPYCTFDNNPLNIIDSNGAGGITTKEKQKDGSYAAKTKATIYIYIYIYIDDDNKTFDINAFASKLKTSLEKQYNNDGGTMTMEDGQELKALFEFNVVPISMNDAMCKAENNTDLSVNFFYVTGDTDPDGAPSRIGSNNAFGGNSGVLNSNAAEKVWAH